MTQVKQPIRLVLLDDHPIIRRSIEVVINKIDDIEIVGSFGHSRDFLKWLRNNECDVLMLDYILQSDEMDGLSLIKQFTAHYPDLNILLCSSMESLAIIRSAYILGIRGYIAKREEVEAYIAAVRTIATGQRYIASELASKLSQLPNSKCDVAAPKAGNGDAVATLEKILTPREAEVIHCYLEGMSIIEISAKLKRSRKTISGHKQNGMKKLGLNSDLELFKYKEHLFN